MKRIALIAALTATIAAPALANSSFAIQHFNQDIDQVTELRAVPADDVSVFVSTSGRSVLGDVFAHFNQDEDRVTDLRGVAGATVVQNNGVASDIFALIRAEGLENE